MGSPGGRRLRPLAVLCALLLVAWGAASAIGLYAQINDYNDVGWPDQNADPEVWWSIVLLITAASSGCWVALWGLFGLGWRPPLHLGILALMFAVAVEIVANVVQAKYIGKYDAGWSFGDQLKWYGDRVTFSADGLAGDRETRGFFIALPLVTAAVPFLCWVMVLVTGAGSKRPAYGYGGPAYPQPYYASPPQPYYAPPPVYQQPAPVYQQPPVPQAWQQPPPAYQPPPPQPRVAWQQVPPVVPQQRPAPPAPPPPKPPDQQETLPYRKPGDGS